jgi:hypothetical protein
MVRRGELGADKGTRMETMYDVVYLDHANRSEKVAQRLIRELAVSVARVEAERRGVGRMFLTGSESPAGGVVLIVESELQAA